MNGYFTLLWTNQFSADRYCNDLKEEIACVSSSFVRQHVSDFYSRFIIEKLPEGGEGIHGYDDGEGDD